MSQTENKTSNAKDQERPKTAADDEHVYEPEGGIGLKRIVRVHIMSRWQENGRKKRRPVQGIGAMYPRLNG